jgi:hypothetical protein
VTQYSGATMIHAPTGGFARSAPLQLSPQHVQGKNDGRAEQPQRREKRQKSLRRDEMQRWVHGESLCDDANRVPNANS